METTPELAAFLCSHAATDAEVKLLCKDLQVLGRSEFKQLLRWRLLVKKDVQRQAAAAKAAAKAVEAAADGEAGSGEESGSGSDKEVDEDEDPEEKLLREMGEVKDR